MSEDSAPDVEVWDYADELMSIPRAHLALELHQDEDGLIVSHDGRDLARCHLTSGGMTAAGYVARALGVQVPALGKSVSARVSTGVLFRAVAIARLDFRNEQSYQLLDRWLEEAALQRGGSSAET